MHRNSHTIPTQQDQDLYKLAVREENDSPQWLDYCFNAFRDDASKGQAQCIRELARGVNQDWQSNIIRRSIAARDQVPDITPLLRNASEQIHSALSKEVGDLPIIPTSDDEAGRTQKLGNFLLFHTARQRSNGPVEKRWTPVDSTGDAESVELTVALVREYADGHSKGVLATLTLWRWPVPGSNAPEGGARLIPAPVQCTVPNDAKFVKALDNANLWLAQQLAKDAPPPKAPHAPWKQHIIAYEIHQPDEDTYMLHGPSASAAMALGAAWLMRDWMPDTLGQTLRTLPKQALQKLVLSADVVDEDGRLGSVGGAKVKQASVHALSPYLEPMEAKHFGLHLAKALAAEVNIAKPYAACVGHFDMASVINWLGRNASELTEPQMQLLQRLNEQRRQVPTDRVTTDDSLLLTLDEITKPLLQQVFNAPKYVRTAQAYGLYHWARWARPQAGCPCGEQAMCIGKRGGHYCIAPNGNKRYH